MYTLNSITKRNNAFLHHIEVRKSDRIQYVEMRRHKLNSKSIYLMCTSIKYSAKISLNIKSDITIIKCVHKFSNNISDSTMLNLENYGEIFHNHRNCQDIRNDETCRMTRHEEHCYKKGVKIQSAIIVKK